MIKFKLHITFQIFNLKEIYCSLLTVHRILTTICIMFHAIIYELRRFLENIGNSLLVLRLCMLKCSLEQVLKLEV
jgi:hypothetical protein